MYVWPQTYTRGQMIMIISLCPQREMEESESVERTLTINFEGKNEKILIFGEGGKGGEEEIVLFVWQKPHT